MSLHHLVTSHTLFAGEGAGWDVSMQSKTQEVLKMTCFSSQYLGTSVFSTCIQTRRMYSVIYPSVLFNTLQYRRALQLQTYQT